MKKFLFLFMCVLSFEAYATITAHIDYPDIEEGQVIEYHIYSDQKKSGKPDLSPLEKDFQIVSQTDSFSYQNNNGKVSANYDLTLGLMPKKVGNLIIPSLDWDSDKTEPISVNILKASAQDNQSFLFIEGKFLQDKTYPDSPVIYRAIVLTRYNLMDGVFGEPLMEKAKIIPVGRQQRGKETRNNQVYETMEQDYAIFPSQSGDSQQVLGATFKGAFALQKGFGYFDTKTVFVRAPDLTLDVLAKPKSFENKWWLPASQVQLTEEYQPTENFKEGDSITRTVKMTALGVLETQLPTIHISSSLDFKVYEEKPQKNTTYESKKGLVSSSLQSFVFVPLHSGKIVLPAIHLSWFNTQTKQEEELVLPEKTILVDPVLDEKESSFEKTSSFIEKKDFPSTKELSQPVLEKKQSAESQKEFHATPFFQDIYAKENNILFLIAGICIGIIFGVLVGVFLAQILRRKKKLEELYPQPK